MKEYEALLDYCGTLFAYGTTLYYTRNYQRDPDKAEIFLKKYYLPSKEYIDKWKPIQDNIFNILDQSLDAMVFKSDFEILAMHGGNLFDKQKFENFQACMVAIGEENFIIIENKFNDRRYNTPGFYMKFPTMITWDEMLSGNFISHILCGDSKLEFLLYGESGNWGIYAANDYRYPFDIIAFKDKCSAVFKEKYPLTQEDKTIIENYLPIEYKVRLIKY